jgi:hypothetical protein
MLMFAMGACSIEGTEITIPPTTYPPENSGPSKPIMKEPPRLTVSFGEDDTFDAVTGIYAWSYDNGDGTKSGIDVDSPHPLEMYEYLLPMETTESFVELQFEVPPQSLSVRCWNDTCWGNTMAEYEIATVSGNMLELKGHGYIYELEATWTGENLAANGSVHYVFYIVRHLVQYAHDNPLARTKQTGNIPESSYYGNTVTKILIDGKEYSFEGTDSVTLTDILITLEYDRALVCKCLPDFYVDTELGATYGVSLSGYARCEAGQADLTRGQLELIRKIIENQT